MIRAALVLISSLLSVSYVSAQQVDANSAWLPVGRLLAAHKNIGAVPADSTLRRSYIAWQESGRLLLRSVGLDFVKKFPSDARVCQWLSIAMTGPVDPVPEGFTKQQDGSFRGIYPDSVLRTLTAWNDSMPKLVKTCLDSQSPSDDKSIVAGSFVSGFVRSYSLRLALKKIDPNDVPWNDLQRDVLDVAAKFPEASDWRIRNPVRGLVSLLERYRSADLLPEFLDHMRSSPNHAVQELAMVSASFAEARKKPIEMIFTALDGRQIDLSKMRGQVVLLYFWATDCGPCRAQLPVLKSTYDKYHKQGFEILGIALENGEDRKSVLEQYIVKNKIPWPQHFSPGEISENPYARKFGFIGIPEMFLLGKDGLLISSEVRDKLEQLVNTALGS